MQQIICDLLHFFIAENILQQKTNKCNLKKVEVIKTRYIRFTKNI